MRHGSFRGSEHRPGLPLEIPRRSRRRLRAVVFSVSVATRPQRKPGGVVELSLRKVTVSLVALDSAKRRATELERPERTQGPDTESFHPVEPIRRTFDAKRS